MEGATISEAPSNVVYIATAVVFMVGMLLESLLPRRELEQGLASRWLNNFTLGGLSWYISALAGTWMVIWLSSWATLHQVGLLHYVGGGAVVGFVALLLVTQFISYWVHYAFHNVPLLWPIHVVHHSDVDVDVSTSYRHHPLEPLVSLPIVAPVILLLGATVEATVAYRLFSVAATVFSHSNVRVPEALERRLRLVLLTPDYHRLHHCAEPTYTNSNYGSLVPWFDYLFGTAKHRPFDEQTSMPLGLEYLRESRDSRVDQLLLTPLKAETHEGARSAV